MKEKYCLFLQAVSRDLCKEKLLKTALHNTLNLLKTKSF